LSGLVALAMFRGSFAGADEHRTSARRGMPGGDSAREHVTGMFSIERLLSDVEEFYDELLARQCPGSS
jgi:hypothetical protein